MNILDALNERHSVRQYTDRPIEENKRKALDDLIGQINAQAGTHIQIFYDEPKCFHSLMAHYGKFSGVQNYIALVGKKSAQLEETLGYYGEKIVVEAQTMGLNTCWVALTHGKSKAKIDSDDRQVCLIAVGYGAVSGVAHKSKSIQQVSNYTADKPDWFLRGVQAALLAPTAVNQQKFYFTWNEDGTVSARCGRGFYTRMDLGIAKYHFELGAGCYCQFT